MIARTAAPGGRTPETAETDGVKAVLASAVTAFEAGLPRLAVDFQGR
ncbi:hypothetical protein ACFTY7_24525 [Streptomyces sp. NPDC057062]